MENVLTLETPSMNIKIKPDIKSRTELFNIYAFSESCFNVPHLDVSCPYVAIATVRVCRIVDVDAVIRKRDSSHLLASFLLFLKNK